LRAADLFCGAGGTSTGAEIRQQRLAAGGQGHLPDHRRGGIERKIMGDKSKIEWTEATWNPVTGCDKVSAGCLHCYAETMAKRLQAMGQANYSAGFKVRTHEPMLRVPIQWTRPRTIFVNSMSDLFHPAVPFAFIDRVYAIMAMCGRHTFQVLTKRPERAVEYYATFDADCNTVSGSDGGFRLGCAAGELLDGAWIHGPGKPYRKMIEQFICDTHDLDDEDEDYEAQPVPWPLPNVWVGTSIENQPMAERRMPELVKIPAAVRFVSFEPLLGPVDVSPWLYKELDTESRNYLYDGTGGHPDLYPQAVEKASRTNVLQWAIVGGESGHGARPMHPAWARSLRDQMTRAEIPFWFKQWGEWAPASDIDQSQFFDSPPESDPERTMPCKVPQMVLQSDGRDIGFQFPHGAMTMYCCGKHRAGRLLDGREWKELPK
jgi:protein gp37